jgi:heptosyltransferase-1
MKILLIKTSSLGDVIHTLPALTDAKKAIPDIEFHWVVEERFTAIAHWHPAVTKVIPIALRRWKKKPFHLANWKEWRAFKKILQSEDYDLVIDAQGLLKSALLTRCVKTDSAGYDKHSIREPLASYFYKRKFAVSRKQHAIDRIRQLMCQALYYPFKDEMPDYGINRIDYLLNTGPYILFFHGTTWENKHWPEKYWIQLAKLAAEKQIRIKLAWGSSAEKERAERIASRCDNTEVLPDLDLKGLAPVIASAQAVVTVDTGLGHLAAAFAVPTLALFGPTDPDKNGILGELQYNLAAKFDCAPCLKRSCSFKGKTNVWPACFSTVTPELVWEKLSSLFK